MNLQQLRDYIRVQLDMDEEELPNALLDSYLQEAYLRTLSMERQWPFFETWYEVAWTPGSESMVVPAECDSQQIVSLINVDNGHRMIQISNEIAEDRFVQLAAASATPQYYSIWGTLIYLWPRPYADAALNFRMRGFRYPVDWIAQGASGEIDADVRLHVLLAHYAIALCYAQQEDEVLEDTYMKRWMASYQAAHNAICAPRHHRPLILNGGLTIGQVPPDLAWNLT